MNSCGHEDYTPKPDCDLYGWRQYRGICYLCWCFDLFGGMLEPVPRAVAPGVLKKQVVEILPGVVVLDSGVIGQDQPGMLVWREEDFADDGPRSNEVPF